jgi:glycosyltransferase involved in cell wall biosynthesis
MVSFRGTQLQETPILSICIATYNRAEYIGETLTSILEQVDSVLPSRIEINVVDGASTDNTESVMSEFIREFAIVNYYRLSGKGGVDKDFDIAVGKATGRYCWLLSDDDPVKENAVATIIENLMEIEPGLLIVNSEVRNATLDKVIVPSLIGIGTDQLLAPGDMDSLLACTGNYLSFIGSVVIRRSLWEERQREKYYGTEFIHLGVIFQSPVNEPILILTDPLIKIRLGNTHWSLRSFEIWGVKWPRLVWSFSCVSEEIRASVASSNSPSSTAFQLIQRAKGGYSAESYHKYLEGSLNCPRRVLAWTISLSPILVINLLVTLVFQKNRAKHALSLYELSVVRKNIWNRIIS